MPELRRDPVSGRWVILSPERRHRPHAVPGAGPAGEANVADCPFCPGNEALTPPEVHVELDSHRPAAAPAWGTRVVPNRYPALEPVGGDRRAGPGDPDAAEGTLRPSRAGLGVHEVIIEGPEHGVALADLPLDAVERVLRAARTRMRDLGRNEGIEYVQVFKNHGAAAGASLEHGHAQLIALPAVPAAVREELDGAARYRERTGRCVFCDLVAGEREEGRRIVLDHGDVVVLAPWAPRLPYETWIVPVRHEASFVETDDASLRFLARALRESLARLRRALGDPHYNAVLHTAPRVEAAGAAYHWHLEILPRLIPLGGFEWGTGMTINTMPPEEAAQTLRRTET